MTAWIAWSLLVVGWVYFITESAVFAPIRMGFASTSPVCLTFIYCPGCTGFWVGALLGSFEVWPITDTAGFWIIGSSAIASMGLAATWSKLTGGNSAWTAESATVMRALGLEE